MIVKLVVVYNFHYRLFFEIVRRENTKKRLRYEVIWKFLNFNETLVQHHFKKDIPEQTIWYHLDTHKYSYKSARPHPYKGNKEQQESFKKRALQKSWSK